MFALTLKRCFIALEFVSWTRQLSGSYGGKSKDTPAEYVLQIMIFGSGSSPCSAQFVKNVNAKLYKNTHPGAFQAMVENHYVDGYVDCFDTDNIPVVRDVVNIYNKAGFELRAFVSNSAEFLAAMRESEQINDGLTFASSRGGVKWVNL